MKEKILNLLEIEGELPPLPDIVIRLQEMTRSLNTNIKDIARLIEMDPVLAWNIIKLSNSVYYIRSTTPIKTLPVAITKIGLNELMKLVYSLKLCPLFSDSTFLNNSQFWLHSLAVALLAQSLCARIKATQEERDIVYLAGLMHDVGIMTFEYLIPIEYSDFISNIRKTEKTLGSQEKNAFGINHAELGALYIDRWWDVDDNITNAVRYHHDPFPVGTYTGNYIQLVHIANSICNNHGITNGIECFTEDFNDDILLNLGFSHDEIETVVEQVQDSLEQAKELVSHSFSG